MIEITPSVIVVVSLAAFLVGLTKAGFGGGLGPIITAIMVLTLPVGVALGIQLPILILGDIFSVAAFWRRWSSRHFLRLIIGAVPGVLVGTYLLVIVDPAAMQRLIGVVALSFVVYRLLQPHLSRVATVKDTAPLGALAGTLGGTASTVAHAGAPPVSAYLMIARTSPVEYTATHILLFAVINLMKMPGYLATGLTDPGLQLRLAPTLVLLPIGVWVGRWMVTRIPPQVFDRFILVILTVTGLYLLIS